jgi:hypothetical protein
VCTKKDGVSPVASQPPSVKSLLDDGIHVTETCRRKAGHLRNLGSHSKNLCIIVGTFLANNAEILVSQEGKYFCFYFAVDKMMTNRE